MKIAIFNQHINDAATQSGLSRQEILKQLQAKGVQGLEYGIQEITDIEAIKQELATFDMEIISIYEHCHYEVDPTIDTHIVDVAEELGVDKLLIIPGFFQENLSDEEVLANCSKAMNEMTAYAKTKNIQITIEDFDNPTSVILDSEKMKWFGDHVADLTYTFDTGNFIFSGEDELEAFDKLKDKIVHVHTKDRTDQPIPNASAHTMATGQKLYSVSSGHGIIQIAEVIGKLKEMNYQGYLTVEHFGAGDYLQSMLDSVDWLNNQL